MIKAGQIYSNKKNNPCVVISVDKDFCCLLSKTKKRLTVNNYGKWYIEYQIARYNYKLLDTYPNW